MTEQSRSLESLQKALAMEMTAVHQYLLHAHVLDDWGLDVLAAKMREEMTEELGHASRFIDRILFLGGEPKVKAGKAPDYATGLEGLFSADLDEEKGAIAFYSDAARAADEDRDLGTRILFEEIVLDEEGHKDWLTRQLSLLERLGEPTYTAQNMSDVAESV
ncbi:bacterioferritin [Ruegeria marina]|uniref:Bacterioferritin n=1 Tax=Ruegeria marina TaxID=639004 RepID=A0A1G6I7G2_9RHOB|nr:bacterioferritin [Ruegeria marina]SDC02391.1 bacterioferritin [Ruegeria marina]